MPCLRRATAINYTDDDEDAEKLLSFMDEAEAAAPGADEEWVATHLGRREYFGYASGTRSALPPS